jgi:hypothetical protein
MENIPKCDYKKLYSLELSPPDFEHVVSGSVNEPFKIHVLSFNKCDHSNELSLSEKIQEFSISISLVCFTNLFEYKFLQMFNLKDILDLFLYDRMGESQDILHWINYLNFFECEKRPRFIDPVASLKSNLRMKSYFINMEGTTLNII